MAVGFGFHVVLASYRMHVSTPCIITLCIFHPMLPGPCPFVRFTICSVSLPLLLVKCEFNFFLLNFFLLLSTIFFIIRKIEDRCRKFIIACSTNFELNYLIALSINIENILIVLFISILNY